jgi:glyoxylase-like metal-dependent hydrolase (beta-lactamase superfamily II)
MVATFPNAKYYVQQKEWEHGSLQLERDAISYMSPNYDPLLETGQMVLLNGDLELLPGISVKVFPGHTANMQAVIIESGGESGGGGNGKKTACYISDLIPTSAHLDLTWVTAFDLFPLETIESRKKYYAQAIPERWLTVFTHDDQTPWGYVERGERGKVKLKTLT